MIKLVYTLTPLIRERFKTIELLRSEILTTVLSPKEELRLRWEAKIARIYYSLGMYGTLQSKQNIIRLLSSSRKRNYSQEEEMVFRYKQSLDILYTTYLATKKQISYKALVEFSSVLKLRVDQSSLESSLQKVFTYLSSGNDHPVIQAAVSYIQIAILEREKPSLRLLAQLTSYAFLYKYGYDLRGLLVLEEELSQKKDELEKLLSGQKQNDLLTDFLEYFTKIYILCCEKILRQLTSSKTRMDIPWGFFDLNSRQKEVLLSLDKPGSTVTNRDVQKMFHISQITASRDLTNLASLGALFPHGKGRSVYYTKV